MGKMQELFHAFEPNMIKLYWNQYTSPRMEFFSNEVPGVPFGSGFLVAIKHGFMDIPHIHDGADNYFIFTGPTLDNIWEDEFEVDMFMGDSAQSMEMYKITKPTVVHVPAGVWHCPVYYKNVGRGINNFMWYKGTSTGRVYPKIDENGEPTVFYEKDNWVHPCKYEPEKNCVYCGRCFCQEDGPVNEYMKPLFENMSHERKYANCIHELKPDYHSLGDAVVSPRITFGQDDLPFIDREFSFNAIVKPCKLGDDEPVSNGQIAEFIWFSGCDSVDPWNSFDAEVEIMLGEDPDHMEKVVFDKPGVIAVHPGIWRGPITVKRVGKPLFMQPWYMSDKERYKITQKTIDGEKVKVFEEKADIKEPTPGDELFMFLKK